MDVIKDGIYGFAKDEALSFGKEKLKAGLKHAYEYSKDKFNSAAEYYNSVSAAREKQREYGRRVIAAKKADGSHSRRGPAGSGSNALAVIRQYTKPKLGFSKPGDEPEPYTRFREHIEARRIHKHRYKGMPYSTRRRFMRHANRGNTRRTGGRSIRPGSRYVKGRFHAGAKRGTGGHIGRKSRTRSSVALVATSSAYRKKALGSCSSSFSRAVAANQLADAIAPATSASTSSTANQGSTATQYFHSDAAVAIKRAYGICGTFFFPGTSSVGAALANDFTRDQTNILSIYSPNDIKTIHAATAITGSILYTKHAKTTITLTNMDVLSCVAQLSFWESRDYSVPSTNILANSNGAGGAMSNSSPSPLAFLQYGMVITGQSTINTSDGVDRRSFNETDSPTFCSMYHRYHTEEFMMMPGVDYIFHIEERKTRCWDFSKIGNSLVETNYASMKGQKFMTGRFHGGTIVDNTGVVAYGVVPHSSTIQGGATSVDQGQVRIAGVVNKSIEFYQADDATPTSTYQAGSFTAIAVPTGISLAGGGIVADAGAGG